MSYYFLPGWVAGALLINLARLGADEVPLTPVLESATGLAGKQTKLTWSPQSNVRCRVEKSTTLGGGAGGWSVRALVDGGEWMDPEPPSTRAFYRVPEPQPEVFSISPTLLGSVYSPQLGLTVAKKRKKPESSSSTIRGSWDLKENVK